MKVVLKLIVMVGVVFLASCDTKEKEIEQLKEETMEIHDEVMPKMDEIMRLKRSLKAIQDTVYDDDSKALEIQKLISALENSDKAMMTWMRSYDPQMTDLSESAKIEYLKIQRASILEVSNQMKQSIAEAQLYLKE